MVATALQKDIASTVAKVHERESIGERIVQEKRFPHTTPSILSHYDIDERTVFDEIGWDEARVTHENWRLTAIDKFGARAGTSEDRSKAAKRVVEMTAISEKRGALLEKEIAKLESELRAINDALRDAYEEVGTRERARIQLRQYVRPAVKAEHARLTTIAKRTLKGEELTAELAKIDSMLDENAG